MFVLLKILFGFLDIIRIYYLIAVVDHSKQTNFSEFVHLSTNAGCVCFKYNKTIFCLLTTKESNFIFFVLSSTTLLQFTLCNLLSKIKSKLYGKNYWGRLLRFIYIYITCIPLNFNLNGSKYFLTVNVDGNQPWNINDKY